MSDRIIVMNEGRVTGEIEDCSSATQEDVMKLATKEKSSGMRKMNPRSLLKEYGNAFVLLMLCILVSLVTIKNSRPLVPLQRRSW